VCVCNVQIIGVQHVNDINSFTVTNGGQHSFYIEMREKSFYKQIE